MAQASDLSAPQPESRRTRTRQQSARAAQPYPEDRARPSAKHLTADRLLSGLYSPERRCHLGRSAFESGIGRTSMARVQPQRLRPLLAVTIRCAQRKVPGHDGARFSRRSTTVWYATHPPAARNQRPVHDSCRYIQAACHRPHNPSFYHGQSPFRRLPSEKRHRRRCRLGPSCCSPGRGLQEKAPPPSASTDGGEFPVSHTETR